MFDIFSAFLFFATWSQHGLNLTDFVVCWNFEFVQQRLSDFMAIIIFRRLSYDSDDVVGDMFPNRLTVLGADCILFVDDFSVHKQPTQNGRKFYISCPGTKLLGVKDVLRLRMTYLGHPVL